MKISPQDLAKEVFNEFEINFNQTHSFFTEPIELFKCNDEITEVVLKEFFEKLTNNTFSFSGSERRSEWEKGWSGTGVRPDPYNKNISIPFYFGKNDFIRINGELYKSDDKFAELKFLRALHFAGYNLLDDILSQDFALAEYGSGTGHNIALAPNKYEKFAYDWVYSSQKHLFNFPEVTFGICDFFDSKTFSAPKKEYVIFTNDALEQTGTNFKKFIDYHVKNKYCLGGIHFEPVPGQFQGTLASQSDTYHYSRGYLVGLIEYLNLYEFKKQINKIWSKPSGLGSKFMTSHHIILWKK